MEKVKIIRSVSDSQTEIIQNILKLHVPGGKIDCDPTFSKGGFYNNTGIERPRYCFDIVPQTEGVIRADCRNLPLSEKSIDCMMFDPPFLATKGKSLNSENGNIINRRFGVYPTETELHRFYADSIREAYRVLSDNGILIFKCQDKVSSGKQYMSHVFICNTAVECGFYPKDLFIQTAKSRIIADWQRNQMHSRKFHCFWFVFQKTNIKVKYT